MAEPEVRGVHLFLDKVLLENRQTIEAVPESFYVIRGDRFEVVSYLEVLESDGGRGFDVQLRPLDDRAEP